MEPIGERARTQGGAANFGCAEQLTRLAQTFYGTISLEWFNVLRQALISCRPARLDSSDYESMLSVGFDLMDSRTMLKAFSFLESRAREPLCSKLDILSNAIASL